MAPTWLLPWVTVPSRPIVRRSRHRIEGDGRAAGIEDLISIDRQQIAVLVHLEAAIPRVDRAIRALEREPGLALDRDIQRVVRLDDRVRCGRDMKFCPEEAKETFSFAARERISSNFTSSARNPPVFMFATLFAIVLRRFSMATWADNAT